MRGQTLVHNLTVPIRKIPDELVGLRIAHVSDFHFRRWNHVHQAAQDTVLTLDFDFLVVTGDFGGTPHRLAQTAELTRRFFAPIALRVPIYAVLGNHDHPAMATIRDIPVQFLSNRSVSVERAGTAFEIAGVDQTDLGGEDLSAALGDGRRHELTILLAHYPPTVFRLPPGRVDLQLSGHTHGGQIRFPYLGCVWTNDRISCRMSRGLHLAGSTSLHISPGIGVSMPIPLRINCPPEVTVLTIAAAERNVPRAVVGGCETANSCQMGPIA